MTKTTNTLLKLQHWRGSQGKNGCEGAPILAFLVVMLGISPASAHAEADLSWQPRITLIVEVDHKGQKLLRDEIETVPLQAFSRPVVLVNNQPAVLRCDAKIVGKADVRTTCQILSGGNSPAFSKSRWVESRVGKDDRMNFQDQRGDAFVITVRPTRVSLEKPRTI